MPVPVSALHVDRCYLTSEGHVVQVLGFLADGQISYAFRKAIAATPVRWTGAATLAHLLVRQLEREVDCDWAPKQDGDV